VRLEGVSDCVFNGTPKNCGSQKEDSGESDLDQFGAEVSGQNTNVTHRQYKLVLSRWISLEVARRKNRRQTASGERASSHLISHLPLYRETNTL